MFYELGLALYSAFLEEQQAVSVPGEYVDIARQVMQKCGWNTQVEAKEGTPAQLAPIEPNNKIMVALSGGLDSVYLLHKLKDQGYDITAVHVAGLNKSSSAVETQAAQRVAHRAGVRFMTATFKAPRQHFPDNPFKNQLVLSILLELGYKRGIYRYACGSDWTTPLSEAVPGFTITDSIEVYRAFWDGIKARLPQAELVFIPDEDKKFIRLRYLFDKGALNDVSSCVSPLRFREHLHEENTKKYNVHLMDGRCGSCYKCAMEYILLCEAGRITQDDAFYAHCWDTLATSKTAHRPDLFAKKLPMEKRLENLLNYGS